MTPNLTREKSALYYYDENGCKIYGVHRLIAGNASGIRGDVSGITEEERKAGVRIESLINK